MKIGVNINCDLGEGMTNDALLMPYLQSCNIACSGHAGDKDSIARTIDLAKQFNVDIGAHPSFPDKINFGRRMMHLTPRELVDSICEQVHLFQEIADVKGLTMHHIKLHGALYNQAAADQKTAEIVLDAFQLLKGKFKIYAPYRSALAYMAQHHYEVMHEAFIDRTYQDNLALTNRAEANALISDPALAWSQLESIWRKKQVTSANGNKIALEADTFCVHGDSENALSILKFIHQKLIND